MALKDEFNREYRAVLEGLSLPERLAGYRPESCLTCREDGEVWLLRDGAGGQFILKLDRAGQRDLAGEFALMERLPQELEGQLPRPVDCFEEGGTQYLLRTYLPGQPLSDGWEGGSPERCVELGRKLCALLEKLHGLEPPVIHRDIKPENVILLPDGGVGLIDFGIARVYKEGQGADTVFMGTRSTAPPEQYGYAQTDRRADIYSLGVTLRWMLTGSYRPEALEEAACPRGLKKCLNRAAAFSPKDRYSSAGELGRALSEALKRPWKKWLAAACAVLLLAGAALCWPWGSGGAVEFDNALLEQAVRAELDRPEGKITYGDLEQVERLAVVGRKLLGEEQNYRYTAYGYIDHVGQLGEPSGDISDLSLLARMPNLKVLYLCQQQIRDISPLAGLPLEELYLPDNQIDDLSPLEGMRTLRTLNIANNPMGSLSSLSSLSSLLDLNLDSFDDGYVDSFTPLSGLPLRRMSLNNRIPIDGDWSPMGTLDYLEELYLWRPSAEALGSLSGAERLRHLSVGEYQGEDLSPLRVFGLESLGLMNGIPSLEGIQQLETLSWLDLEGLEGQSLEPLAQLPKLEFISVNNCRDMDYTPLLRCPALKSVDAWDDQCARELERDCPEREWTLNTAG